MAERGPRGYTGEEGPRGPEGPAGKAGDTGIQGVRGPEGAKGEPGPQGIQGPEGRIGRTGDTGATGKAGETGPAGKRGPKGERGPEGPVGPAPEHDWEGTSLKFRQPDGEWGELVNLKGPKGDPGHTGVVQIGGTGGTGSGATGDPGPPGEDATAEFKTGFPNRTDSTLAFDESTRTVTIAPVGASFSTWTAGVERVYSTAQTIVIPNTTSPAYIYFDKDTGVISQLSSFDLRLIDDDVYAAVLYWNATQGKAVVVGDERHGLVMDHMTHGYLHLTRGAAWNHGLDLADIVADGDGSLDAQAQLTVNDGVFYDEDIRHTLVSIGGSLPIIWEEPAGTWKIAAPASYPVMYSGRTGTGYTGASGRLAYNSAGALTEVGNGKFVLALIGATNDIRYPAFAVCGTTEYSTISNARAAAYEEWKSLTGLPFTEWAPLGAVIFQSSAAYSNTPKALIRTTDEGGDYIDLRGNLSLGSIAQSSESVQREVFVSATAPTVTYPAINFLEVTGYAGLKRMQVNA